MAASPLPPESRSRNHTFVLHPGLPNRNWDISPSQIVAVIFAQCQALLDLPSTPEYNRAETKEEVLIPTFLAPQCLVP